MPKPSQALRALIPNRLRFVLVEMAIINFIASRPRNVANFLA